MDYYALLGDVVGSRELSPDRREGLQEALRSLLEGINSRWAAEIAAGFAVTQGDQLQGLLERPHALWQIMHEIRAELVEVDWVMAVGLGPVSTRLGGPAPEQDGPCFHRAREALEAAKEEGSVLAFGGMDHGLTALGRYYSALYWSWTQRQRRAALLLRVTDPEAVARRLGVGRSAVSHLASRMSWGLVERADAEFRERMGEDGGG